MKAKLFISACALVILAACTKDQFTTAPQLTFTSVSTQTVAVDQLIVFTLEYTDREGDIQDSLFIQKQRIDICNTGGVTDSGFAVYYPMPSDVPTQKSAKGEIQVKFLHASGNPNYPDIGDPRCPGNDTCIFKFVLHDKAGNKSDTAYSPQIVVIKR